MPSPTPSLDPTLPLAVVVLAGGEGRRLGGPDKPSVRVGAHTLLDHVLLGCPDGASIVVVGPPRPTTRPVRWTREDPPGGGPVAGLVAGLAVVSEPLVLVLAADLPNVAAAVPGLVAAARGAVANGRDGAWAVDSTGRPQPLVSCLATAVVRRELPVRSRGAALHRVLSRLRLDPVEAPEGSVTDVDTEADLVRVRHDRPHPAHTTPEEMP